MLDLRISLLRIDWRFSLSYKLYKITAIKKWI
jgi:hypothetical protein